MNNIYLLALDAVDMGVILVDSEHNIVFVNKYIEKISGKEAEDTLYNNIKDIISVFNRALYQNSLQAVFDSNQSRFFSSKIHKAFLFPKGTELENYRQNMKIEPLKVFDEMYAMIQIDDVTNEVINERKLISFINKLEKDYKEIKESEKKNKTLAKTDSLTGLYNRHSITQHITELLKSRKDLSNKSLMFLDLDCFKSVNDTYGHLVGDALLIKVADVFRSLMSEGDVAARLGGDEFLMLIDNNHNEDSYITQLAQKILEKVAEPIFIEDIKINITISIGIARFQDSIESAFDIIDRADEAMYKAKKNGKNSYVLS